MNATVQLNMLHLRLLEYKHVLYTPICYSCHWCSLACSCLNEIPAVMNVFSFERSLNTVLCLFRIVSCDSVSFWVLCDFIIISCKTTFDTVLFCFCFMWKPLCGNWRCLCGIWRGLCGNWRALCGNWRGLCGNVIGLIKTTLQIMILRFLLLYRQNNCSFCMLNENYPKWHWKDDSMCWMCVCVLLLHFDGKSL